MDPAGRIERIGALDAGARRARGGWRRGGVLVVVVAICLWRFFGLLDGRDATLIGEMAIGAVLVLVAGVASRPWFVGVLMGQGVTWCWVFGVGWAWTERDQPFAYATEAQESCVVDPATRLYECASWRWGGHGWSPMRELAQETRWHGAHLLAHVFGPPKGAYLGPLLTLDEATVLARDAKPVTLSIDAVATLFADPDRAAGMWFSTEKWPEATTLAAAPVSDEAVLLVWDGGARLELYDRQMVQRVLAWEAGAPVPIGEWEPSLTTRPTLKDVAMTRHIQRRIGNHVPNHALWLRRRWLHEPRTDDEVRTLVARLHAHDIDTVYPFVGPKRPGGRFGWRDGDTLREYDREAAAAFFTRARAAADADESKLGLRILPWTGGVLDRDVHLADPRWRADFVAEARALVALGADGIQVNIEPMPSFAPGYLELLAELREGLGPDAIIGVAAYPPPTPLHPYEDVHWSLEFLAEVCRAADDVAVMAYDTSLTTPEAYAALMTAWTDQLGATLPAPDAPDGCAWRMGLPTYEDDEAWHRPDAETIGAALDGILAASPARPHDGFAIYASWTTDPAEWATFDVRARGFGPLDVEAIDPR